MANNQRNIWLFDIDGVLTNPQKKIVPNDLITLIANLVKSGDSIAFVTGRSFDWAIKNVVSKLKKELKDNDFKKVFISAEKGGVWSWYFDKKWVVHIDKKCAPPQALAEKVTKLVVEKFSDTMFMDQKATMISVEMRSGLPPGKFQSQQAELDKILKEYLLELKLSKNFLIDSGIIATDIQHANSGKDLGATRVTEWIKNQNASYSRYYAFGDSRSDIKMAQALSKDKHNVTFIFTGKKKDLAGAKLSFPCKVYDERFEKGTLEFFKSLGLGKSI